MTRMELNYILDEILKVYLLTNDLKAKRHLIYLYRNVYSYSEKTVELPTEMTEL